MDVEQLLQPVGGESPCGPSLKSDEAYRNMLQYAEGQPERGIGKEQVEAVPPDWEAVKEAALGLLERTKDLNVAAYLTRAWVRVDGFEGLDSGLRLLNGLVQRYWDDIHPTLDPERDNDPTRRMNCLRSVASESMVNFLKREAPIARSRSGTVSFRDALIADGKASAPNDDARTQISNGVREAFSNAGIEELESRSATVGSALVQLAELDKLLESKADDSPDFQPMQKVLQGVQGLLQVRIAEQTGNPVSGGDGDVGAHGSGAMPNRVTSREEVSRLLDLAIEYFARNEPSSPVPDYLQRAKDLIGMDFMTILQEMAPGGVADASTVLGKKTE